MKQIIALIIVLLISLNGFAQTEIKPVKISALLHLSGDYAMEGSAFKEGIELGVEDVNTRLAIKNIAIKVDFQDTRYLTKEVVTLAHRATIEPEVKGIIVTTFFEMKPISPIIERAKVSSIVLWDAAPEIDDFGHYTFAIGPWAPDTGEKCARFAMNNLKSKKVAILHQQHDWSLAVTSAFENKFKQSNLLTEKILLNPDDTDFKTPLLKLKIKAPDAIYAPLVFGVPTFVKQYKTYFPNTPLIMSDNITEHLISQEPKFFENVYHSAVADPDNESSRALINSYFKKHGKSPTLLTYNAWGYDSILMYADAIEKGAQTRQEINEALYKIKNLKGAGGEINMRPSGSAPKYMSMFQIKAGKFKLVSPPDQE